MSARIGAIAAALALAFVLVVHVLAAHTLTHRSGLDVDETEFLHAGILMARGERLYVDFLEHHPPFVFVALKQIAPPAADRAALDRYVIRARVVASICGFLAVLAAGCVVAFATRRTYAAVIVIGVLLASPSIWPRGFADVRDEPPALAAWWIGALLIVVAPTLAKRRIGIGAIGLGLVMLSCLINPKWPVACCVAGVYFLAAAARDGRRAFVRGLLLGAAAMGAAFALLCAAADPRLVFDFVVLLTGRMFRAFVVYGPALTGMTRPFMSCPAMLLPRLVIPAAVFVGIVTATIRDSFPRRREILFFLALAVATLIEIRFIHPYPLLYLQYYVLWCMAGACIYALVPQAAVAIVRRFAPRVEPLAWGIAIVVTTAVAVRSLDALPISDGPQPHAIAIARLEAKLAPGDTVFVDLVRHPIAARDASYYWFGMTDVIPTALQFAQTPAGRAVMPALREADLPPCRLERGLEPHLRLVVGTPLPRLPVVTGCIARLRARGVLVPSGVTDVLLVRRPGELQ